MYGSRGLWCSGSNSRVGVCCLLFAVHILGVYPSDFGLLLQGFGVWGLGLVFGVLWVGSGIRWL